MSRFGQGAVRKVTAMLQSQAGTRSQPHCRPRGYVRQGEQAPACANPGGTAGRAARVCARQGRARPLQAKGYVRLFPRAMGSGG